MRKAIGTTKEFLLLSSIARAVFLPTSFFLITSFAISQMIAFGSKLDHEVN